jgi:hypothetical protein
MGKKQLTLYQVLGKTIPPINITYTRSPQINSKKRKPTTQLQKPQADELWTDAPSINECKEQNILFIYRVNKPQKFKAIIKYLQDTFVEGVLSFRKNTIFFVNSTSNGLTKIYGTLHTNPNCYICTNNIDIPLEWRELLKSLHKVTADTKITIQCTIDNLGERKFTVISNHNKLYKQVDITILDVVIPSVNTITATFKQAIKFNGNTFATIVSSIWTAYNNNKRILINLNENNNLVFSAERFDTKKVNLNCFFDISDPPEDILPVNSFGENFLQLLTIIENKTIQVDPNMKSSFDISYFTCLKQLILSTLPIEPVLYVGNLKGAICIKICIPGQVEFFQVFFYNKKNT